MWVWEDGGGVCRWEDGGEWVWEDRGGVCRWEDACEGGIFE